MSLITIKDLTIQFRGPALLDGVDCEIAAGQKIGLLGRNGAGKTTLMRMLMGDVEPDHGSIQFASGCRVAMMQQEVPDGGDESNLEIVLQGMGDRDDLADWQKEQMALRVLSRMQLDPETRFAKLSSGMKRRVLLARALAPEPDVLLLDEPTNHLDLDSIQWLEGFLARWSGTLVFVTHDRSFLDRLANRILEIDRGRIFDWQCDYSTFLQRKEAALDAEEKQNALFDKKLAEEERWIRQGIKARRTRNMGRVRALEEMRRQRQQRQERQGTVDLKIDSGLKSGQLVAELKNVSFRYGDRTILSGLTTTVMRGDKIGIIGPNGAGKSTLLKILLGQLEPQSGSVRTGTNLQIAYFDQLREQLDGDQTVAENVGDGYENISVGGRSRHVIGYLSDFLFSPERARTPVRFLSGGERNRILLAKLFAKPANVIVLDEPTNDLDYETLEMLEQRLVEYEGTVLLVSHDRTFLDNVVTSTLVFQQDGVHAYDGGYQDWQRQVVNRPAETPSVPAERSEKKSDKTHRKSASVGSDLATSGQRKLKFTERKELEDLPEKIELLEADIAAESEKMADPEFYQQPSDKIAQAQAQLNQQQEALRQLYERWEELESLEN